MRSAVAVATLVLTALISGCTSGGSAGPTSTRTITRTRSEAPPPAATFTPAPAATVPPLRPGERPGRDAVDRRCPYIRSGPSETRGGGVNLADIDGSHVYRTTVLTGTAPVGCRFYFYAPPYQAIADIRPMRFPTATEAHNALVLTAQAGTEAISAPDFVPGVDGISYRTKFFGDDGARDWAFAFAKGRLLVVTRTDRTDTSRNAVYVGKAIVARF